MTSSHPPTDRSSSHRSIVTSRSLGDQGVESIEALESAAEAGGVEAVVLDEDATGHFGAQDRD